MLITRVKHPITSQPVIRSLKPRAACIKPNFIDFWTVATKFLEKYINLGAPRAL